MDVRCSRCGTEYEFDDALISERGTTVKCTNCGFQFKIFPGEGKGGAPERWVVRTASGRELVYTSLRELQRGIADKKVGPNDLLSRGKQAPRPLASIAELEPFFQVSSTRNAAELERAQRTLHGVAPPANSIGGSLVKGSAFAPAPIPPATPAPAPVPPAPSAAAQITKRLTPEPPAAPVPMTKEELDFEPAPTTARLTAPGGLGATRAQLDALSETLPADFLRSPSTTLPGGSPALAPALAPRAPEPALEAPRVPYQTAPATLLVPQTLSERDPDSITVPRAPAPIPLPRPTMVSNFDSTLEVPVAPRGPVSSPRNIPPISV